MILGGCIERIGWCGSVHSNIEVAKEPYSAMLPHTRWQQYNSAQRHDYVKCRKFGVWGRDAHRAISLLSIIELLRDWKDAGKWSHVSLSLSRSHNLVKENQCVLKAHLTDHQSLEDSKTSY